MIDVLNISQNQYEINQFRITLRKRTALDEEELYKFVFCSNEYTYFPVSLQDEHVHDILLNSCHYLLKAVEENNIEKIKALANCLHNLPIYIVENKHSIPKDFWKREVNYYRKKWDSTFLM